MASRSAGAEYHPQETPTESLVVKAAINMTKNKQVLTSGMEKRSES